MDIDSNVAWELKMETLGGIYRAPIGWRLLPVILSTFIATGIIFLVQTALTGGPWWFFVLWLAGVAWLTFNGVYRTNYEASFDSSFLYWRGFLRTGKVPLDDLVGLDYEYMGSVAAFSCKNGQRLRFVVLQGFAPFLSKLARAHPQLPAVPGWYARLVERAQIKRKSG